MKFFAKLFEMIKSVFRSNNAIALAQRAFALAPIALPIIAKVAEIAVAITPNKIDDAALAVIRQKFGSAYSRFPHLFDGSLRTQEEIQAALAGVAAALLRDAFPEEKQRVLDLAVHAAFIKWKDDQDA